MKLKQFLSWVVFIFTLCGLVAFIFVLISEVRRFDDVASALEKRDVELKSELIANQLDEPLRSGDIYSALSRAAVLGNEIKETGGRLLILSDRGGTIYDSSPVRDDERDDRLYDSHSIDAYDVRVGLPLSAADQLISRARHGHFISAMTAIFGIFFISLFIIRLMTRMRRIVAERDAQIRHIEELERAEAYRREFVSGLAHELRTPLAGIMASVEMLSGEGVDDDTRSVLFDMLKKESERLNNLSQGILELSRVEMRELSGKVDFSDVVLNEILTDIVARTALRVEQSGLSLRLSERSEEVVLSANATMLDHAVTNLVENAIKYSRGSYIELECRRVGDGRVEISVKDDGVGIPSEAQERIFERFYRVESDRNSDAGGSGLGLSLVKHIAKVHGGDVKVVSDLGKGTCFTISIAMSHPEEEKKK